MELPEENFYKNKSICSNLKFKDNQDGEIEDNIKELAKSVDILENYKNSLSRNSEKNGNDLSKKKDERKKAKYWILEFEKLFSIEELCKLLKEAFKRKPYHIVDEESSGEYIKILIEFENEEKIHVESKIFRKVNLFPKNVITYSARKKELFKKLKNNIDKNKSHRNKLNIDWKYKKIKNILIKTTKNLDKSLIIISKDDIDLINDNLYFEFQNLLDNIKVFDYEKFCLSLLKKQFYVDCLNTNETLMSHLIF